MSEITLPVTLNRDTLAVTRVTTALPRLQLGDQLQATVLLNRGGRAELQLPQGTVSAKTDLPLRSGEQLKLTVTQTQPQITLSLNRPAPPPTELLSQKIYPRQLPLSQAIQSLGELMQSQTGGKGSQLAIQQLLQQLPTLAQLFNPKGLKGEIERSGNFMENNLLHNREEALKGDLKMQLLQLKSKLLHQPEQQKVVRQLDAMIARIELNQLKTAQGQPQGSGQSQQEAGGKEPVQRNWQLEIPFLVDDQAQEIALKFRQQQEPDDEEGQSRWHIELNLAPPGLGGMEIHAIYHQGRLDIHFLSEREETSQLISGQLEQLEASLSVAGLQTGVLFSRQKSINDAPPPPIAMGALSIKV